MNKWTKSARLRDECAQRGGEPRPGPGSASRERGSAGPGTTGGARGPGRGRTCAAGLRGEWGGRGPGAAARPAPRAPPRRRGPPAAARCAAPGSRDESAPQLQGRPGRVTPRPAWRPRRAPGREVSAVPTPREPPNCAFPAAIRSRFSRPRSAAAPGGREAICRSASPLLPAEPSKPGPPRRAAGTSRDPPQLRAGGAQPAPRPLVLRARAPQQCLARSWAGGPEFRPEPSQLPSRESGSQRTGRAGAGVWGPGGRGVGRDAALRAARLLCSPSSGSGGPGRRRRGTRLREGLGGGTACAGEGGARGSDACRAASLGEVQRNTHLGGQVCTE